MHRIGLFIFDMGGVVSRNNDFLTLIATYLGVTVPEFHRCTGDDWQRMMTGKLSPVSFWRRMAEEMGLTIKEDLFARYFHPRVDPTMIQIVSQLKEKARVVVGTNTIESHYGLHQQLGDYDSFDAVYASHLLGVAKPDQRFYQKILKAECRAPSETVFIDDLEENVDAARKMGIFSILFIGAGELELQLSPFKINSAG
jgi:HAD superfamily hydrolase (TIGR01509 family)